MELAELRALVGALRELGVTKYRAGDVELVLGEPTAKPAPVDLGQAALGIKPGRSPELQAALARLDPMYADPSLFDIAEVPR